MCEQIVAVSVSRIHILAILYTLLRFGNLPKGMGSHSRASGMRPNQTHILERLFCWFHVDHVTA